MKKVFCKLIRDRIPEIIESQSTRCVTRVLTQEEYLTMVDAKLDEDLADLLEVIYAAAEAKGYSKEQLEQVRQAKALGRGGFQKKLLLLEVRDS